MDPFGDDADPPPVGWLVFQLVCQSMFSPIDLNTNNVQGLDGPEESSSFWLKMVESIKSRKPAFATYTAGPHKTKLTTAVRDLKGFLAQLSGSIHFHIPDAKITGHATAPYRIDKDNKNAPDR